jgi:UDP-2,4-diacetamido-2,4,6-trideoxy-beta-L-altropyranose hydrolase
LIRTVIAMPDGTLLIRADASSEIGIGHVMRSAALAQAWQSSGGRAIFALANGARELEDRLSSWGSEVAVIRAEPGTGEDAAETNELCQRHRAYWLALDGYHFSQDYRTVLRKGGARLLLMDDLGDCAPYNCDIVLNDNPQAAELFNSRGVEARFLLGPRYALLRQEFLEFRRDTHEVSDRARRILITFGGGDDQNLTLQVMQTLQALRDVALDLTVVVGAGNPHRTSIQKAVDNSPHSARMLSNVKNMPELMSQTDLAISAGGGTCYELAFMRVPMFLIILARNQERTVEAFSEANAAISGGWFDSLEEEALRASLLRAIGDQKLRSRLRENAGQMVDGRGSQRVVDAMCETGHSWVRG